MLLIYNLPMFRLLTNKRIEIMGLVNIYFWLSWWTYYFIIVTIKSALIVHLGHSLNVIQYTNRVIVFVSIELLGLS
jgi:hypothetical protein